MPTRKQRRRREKDFRHDVRVYEVDEEGNEVPISELRAQEDRTAKPKPRSAAKGSRGARTLREPPKPSWDRALKRGGAMGALLVVALYFVEGPAGIAIGLFYAVVFIPGTYWLDGLTYRRYLKRTGQVAPAAKKR
ncbi:MAG TPA: hypothetical protein VFJ93_01805 [Gaiellaceae bacterium]|nr:hypothetical protein [Gaiellaceae bacterium]